MGKKKNFYRPTLASIVWASAFLFGQNGHAKPVIFPPLLVTTSGGVLDNIGHNLDGSFVISSYLGTDGLAFSYGVSNATGYFSGLEKYGVKIETNLPQGRRNISDRDSHTIGFDFHIDNPAEPFFYDDSANIGVFNYGSYNAKDSFWDGPTLTTSLAPAFSGPNAPAEPIGGSILSALAALAALAMSRPFRGRKAL